MERATKLFLIGWACAAIAAAAWLLRGWRGLPMLTLGISQRPEESTAQQTFVARAEPALVSSILMQELIARRSQSC